MQTYVIRRLVLTLFLAVATGSVVFFAMHLAPGDVVQAAMGEAGGLTPEQVAIKRAALGLDRPLLVQYRDWLGGVVRGNLGVSFVNNRPIGHEVAIYFPRTLELMFAALVIGLLLGIPAGVYGAVHQDRWPDLLLTAASLTAVSIPNFVLGTLLLLLFGLRLGWQPVSGFVAYADNPWRHLRLRVLPAITLGLVEAAGIARMSRSSMIEVKFSDYVRTARSKGLPEQLVLFRHTLKNALVPVVTLMGVQIGRLMGGAVIVEFVFTWPGVSTLLIMATLRRDYPVIQGVVFVVAIVFVLINLFVDLLNVYLDPRIRYGRG